MTKGAKTALYVAGGVGLLAVGVTAYAVATDPKRVEGASGDPERRTPLASVADLLDISRSAAQAYRGATSGSGGSGDTSQTDTSLYDAAGGSSRGESTGSFGSQY